MITGNVIIREQVFIAPHSSIRADEPGSLVIIGNGCNIQDNVIIHALTNTKVVIGDYSSLSHGCIVHGPIEVGRNCFIGFGAVVLGQIEADRLEEVTAEHTEFSSSVVRTNILLAESYRLIKRHS